MENPNRFIVKCDDCKKTIKRNASFIESVSGGRCNTCRIKGSLSEKDFKKWVKKEALQEIMREKASLKSISLRKALNFKEDIGF